MDNKAINLYKERGRSGRENKKGYGRKGGLWGKMQSSTPVQKGEFTINLLKEVYSNLFYGKTDLPKRDIKIAISVPAKSNKAAHRKLTKMLKTMIDPLNQQ